MQPKRRHGLRPIFTRRLEQRAAQALYQRSIRQVSLTGVAMRADRHRAGRTQVRQELFSQARLADTGFALDYQEIPVMLDPMVGVFQRSQLTLAADHGNTRRGSNWLGRGDHLDRGSVSSAA